MELKEKIAQAAIQFAKTELGDEQFKNNKDAVQAISENFIAGAQWQQTHSPDIKNVLLEIRDTAHFTDPDQQIAVINKVLGLPFDEANIRVDMKQIAPKTDLVSKKDVIDLISSIKVNPHSLDAIEAIQECISKIKEI